MREDFVSMLKQHWSKKKGLNEGSEQSLHTCICNAYTKFRFDFMLLS